MTTTTKADVTDRWTTISGAGPFAMIQLVTQGPVLVHVGASTPATDSEVGLVLDKAGMSAVGFSALQTGDSVYARSLDEGEDHSLIVVASEAV